MRVWPDARVVVDGIKVSTHPSGSRNRVATDFDFFIVVRVKDADGQDCRHALNLKMKWYILLTLFHEHLIFGLEFGRIHHSDYCSCNCGCISGNIRSLGHARGTNWRLYVPNHS
jgi:hypothetical protein